MCLEKNHVIFLSFSVQLRHSSSLRSILLCQSTTDIPRDVTSTSLPLCPLFTCKSLKLVTHSHAPKHCRSYPRVSAASQTSCALLDAPRRSWTSFRLRAWSILLMGAGRAPLFAFLDQRPRPRACATWSACQRHANEHVSETWKWEWGEGSLGACDSHKSGDQALSGEGSDSSADIQPSLTDTYGLLTHEPYTANCPASANHTHAPAIKCEVK